MTSSNSININTGSFIQEFSKRFKVMFLNAQSVRNKAPDIRDYIMQANVDPVFLCETWLRPEDDEADCANLTRPGFCLIPPPPPPPPPTVWYRWWPYCFTSNQSNKKIIAVSTRDLVFTAFEICEVCLSHAGHSLVFHSAFRPPPSRQN